MLDPDDEKWDNDKVWCHMSRMCHGSKVTFALMFQDMQSTVEVNAADGTLVSPVPTEKKEACFEKGREEWARPEKQQCHEEAGTSNQECHL